MPAARELVELQSVDNGLEARRARLGEIVARLGDDAALRALALRVERFQKELDEASSKQRELDAVVSGSTQRVDAAEAKLYGGAVTSPRELQDLQADVAMLKRQRSHEEDALLAVLEEVDEARNGRDASTAQLESDTASWNEEQRALAAEQEQLRGEVADLEQQRASLIAGIAPAETALYEQVRKLRPGHPVARMHHATCGACLVGVPTRLAQDVRTSSALMRCPNCGRILLPE